MAPIGLYARLCHAFLVVNSFSKIIKGREERCKNRLNRITSISFDADGQRDATSRPVDHRPSRSTLS